MTGSIPADQIVSVVPGVISAGGTALSLSGLLLTTSTRVPVGTVQSFPNQPAVAAYFGSNSQEAALATVYFAGFAGSDVKPGAMLFGQYPTGPVSAYLRGGKVSGLTLSQLQALSGVLSVTIDGAAKTSSAINLTGAASFTAAAQLVNAALGATGPQDGIVTASIAATTMSVSAVSSGQLNIGDVLAGTGVTAGTYITAFATGTGGTGTYTVSQAQTVASTSVTATKPVVTYDGLAGAFTITSPTTGASSTLSFGSGTIAAGLGLTQAAGAVVSPGAAAATPASAMDAIVGLTQNFFSFTTAFEPQLSDKLAFAAWTSGKNNRFAYVGWDTDVTATQTNSAAFGVQVKTNAYSGVVPLYQPQDYSHAAFVMGCFASIDFDQPNGRTTLAFRTQAGITPGVTDATIAAQLKTNGYNFYGAYATATQQFNFLYPGAISGEFLWADSYANQVWLNAALQQAMLTLLTVAKSIPYDDAGYTLIRQAAADPITAAVTFGAIREGVPLSSAQAAEVNADAGQKIDAELSSRGWYLQIVPASAQTRGNRASPPMKLWYMDGQSVQSINIASVEVQ